MFFPVAPGPQKVSLSFSALKTNGCRFSGKVASLKFPSRAKKETRWGKIRGKTEFSFPDRRTLSSKRENI